MQFFGCKAEMGVGTLIIFIALLLVAAVAAGVLIQTAGSLQQRALSTGTQATSQISTNAQIFEVSAIDGVATLDNISLSVKLAPGSDPIQFSGVTITLSLNNASNTYTFSNVSVDGNTTNFGIAYSQRGTNYQYGVLVHGDVVIVNFQAPRGLTPAENVRVNFIPKTGTPSMTLFTIADVVSTQRVYLYP